MPTNTLTYQEGIAIVIKARKAKSFRKDALYNYENYTAASKVNPSSDGDGKVFTLILSAIETNLKAVRLCFSPSDETPEEAFQIARGFGHKVKGLADSVETIRPGWIHDRHKDALDLLNRAETCGGMNQRYDSCSGYDWYTPEYREFFKAFSYLAIPIHVAAGDEVDQFMNMALSLAIPISFQSEINDRVAQLK